MLSWKTCFWYFGGSFSQFKLMSSITWVALHWVILGVRRKTLVSLYLIYEELGHVYPCYVWTISIYMPHTYVLSIYMSHTRALKHMCACTCASDYIPFVFFDIDQLFSRFDIDLKIYFKKINAAFEMCIGSRLQFATMLRLLTLNYCSSHGCPMILWLSVRRMGAPNELQHQFTMQWFALADYQCGANILWSPLPSFHGRSHWNQHLFQRHLYQGNP